MIETECVKKRTEGEPLSAASRLSRCKTRKTSLEEYIFINRVEPVRLAIRRCQSFSFQNLLARSCAPFLFMLMILPSAPMRKHCSVLDRKSTRPAALSMREMGTC